MRECNHYAIAEIAGHTKICRLDVLWDYCISLTRVYWVGEVDYAPTEEVLKILKKFKQWPYCPKCGQKLIFPEVK